MRVPIPQAGSRASFGKGRRCGRGAGASRGAGPPHLRGRSALSRRERLVQAARTKGSALAEGLPDARRAASGVLPAPGERPSPPPLSQAQGRAPRRRPCRGSTVRSRAHGVPVGTSPSTARGGGRAGSGHVLGVRPGGPRPPLARPSSCQQSSLGPLRRLRGPLRPLTSCAQPRHPPPCFLGARPPATLQGLPAPHEAALAGRPRARRSADVGPEPKPRTRRPRVDRRLPVPSPAEVAGGSPHCVAGSRK